MADQENNVKAKPGEKVVSVTDMVKFKAAYPADYPADKKRHMKNGVTYKLHKLHAERLEKKKLGKIITD